MNITKKTLDIREKLYFLQPNNIDYSRALEVIYNKFTDLYFNLKDYNSANNYSQKDIELCEKLLKKYPKNDDIKRDLYVTYSKLADILFNQNNLTNSLSFYKKSIENIYSKNQSIKIIRDLALIYQKTGDVYFTLKNSREALDFYQKAIPLFEKLYKTDSENIERSRKLSTVCSEKYFQFDYDISTKLYGKESSLENTVLLATSLFNLGIIYRLKKDFLTGNKFLENSQKYLKIYENTEKAKNNSAYQKMMELIIKSQFGDDAVALGAALYPSLSQNKIFLYNK